MGKLLDQETKDRIKSELFIECVGSVAIMGLLILAMLIVCVNVCFGAEKTTSKPIKKTVSQSTSRENAVRKQLYNQCKASGTSPSRCYQLYY